MQSSVEVIRMEDSVYVTIEICVFKLFCVFKL